MKKQSDLSRLLGYAGKRKFFSYASWVLAALSALVSLAPFYFIFNIIKEVFETTPDFGNAKNLTFNGWDGGSVCCGGISFIYRGTYVFAYGGFQSCHKYEKGCA